MRGCHLPIAMRVLAFLAFSLPGCGRAAELPAAAPAATAPATAPDEKSDQGKAASGLPIGMRQLLPGLTWLDPQEGVFWKPVPAMKPEDAPLLRRLPPLDASRLEAPSISFAIPAEPRAAADKKFEDWKRDEEFRDEKHGVFVEIAERKAGVSPVGGIQYGTEIEGGKIAWLCSMEPSRKHREYVVMTRVRSSLDTVRYLIETPEAPLRPRLLAMWFFHLEAYSPAERLRLIELASRDRWVAIRGAAVSAATDYRPLPAAIPILCRALCDPDGWIAWGVTWTLEDYFFPTPPDPDSLVRKSLYFSLPPEWVDPALHTGALTMARRIHAILPELVTEEDLATIAVMARDPVKPGGH